MAGPRLGARARSDGSRTITRRGGPGVAPSRAPGRSEREQAAARAAITATRAGAAPSRRIAIQLAAKPRPGEAKIAVDGRLRDAERLAGFLVIEAAVKVQLDDAGEAQVLGFEAGQRRIELEEVEADPEILRRAAG